jgi:hypothetical protein
VLSDTITFVVGEEGNDAKEFRVCKSKATKSSKSIKAALAGDWKEACEKCITIPDHDPAAFEGYLNWISSGQITLSEQRCKHCTPITSTGAACIEAQSLELVEMFILGDFLCDTRLCNAVTDSLKSVSLESYCVPSMSAVRCALSVGAHSS